MSYINEALKKAQKERDTRYFRYAHLVDGGRGRQPPRIRNVPRYLLPPLIVISMIIAVYFWSPFSTGGIDHPGKPKVVGMIKPPRTEVSTESLYGRAVRLYKEGRFHEAEKVYRELLELDPGYVDALNNLGIIYIHHRDYRAAVRHFKKAIRLKPLYAEPYYNLACLYTIKGDKEQGLIYLDRAVEIDDDVRNWARNDSDLDGLRLLPAFKKLVSDSFQGPQGLY